LRGNILQRCLKSPSLRGNKRGRYKLNIYPIPNTSHPTHLFTYLIKKIGNKVLKNLLNNFPIINL